MLRIEKLRIAELIDGRVFVAPHSSQFLFIVQISLTIKSCRHIPFSAKGQLVVMSDYNHYMRSRASTVQLNGWRQYSILLVGTQIRNDR